MVNQVITEQHLQVARAAHEALMTSTCRIGKSLGWVWDPDTGIETQQIAAPVYDGKCKVQSVTRQGGTVPAGGQELAAVPYVVAVPWTVTKVEPGYLVEVTSSPDPRHLLTLQVDSVDGNDFLSARILNCTDHQD